MPTQTEAFRLSRGPKAGFRKSRYFKEKRATAASRAHKCFTWNITRTLAARQMAFLSRHFHFHFYAREFGDRTRIAAKSPLLASRD
ncbi:hypothetical protein, partial [Rhodoblastus sp.]|uniref:hypothetical protein n=1 Tax=Rhodoblastus sp. TaxID=1962975 RepID=UPI003F9E94FD